MPRKMALRHVWKVTLTPGEAAALTDGQIGETRMTELCAAGLVDAYNNGTGDRPLWVIPRRGFESSIERIAREEAEARRGPRLRGVKRQA